MTNLPRTIAPFVLVLGMAASLSACGDEDEPATAPDASPQACRVVAVTHASLAGARDAAVAGRFTAELMATYDAAMTGLGTAMSGQGDVAPEITDAVVELAAAYSRTRGAVEEGSLATSYRPAEMKALVSAEERLYQAVVDVCPALQPADDEDDD